MLERAKTAVREGSTRHKSLRLSPKVRSGVSQSTPDLAAANSASADSVLDADDGNDPGERAGIEIVDVGVSQNKGPKKFQEDRYLILKPGSFPGDKAGTRSLFAVFDGHGGSDVAEHLSQNFHETLADCLHGSEATPGVLPDALRCAMKATDSQLRKRGIGQSHGATVVLAVLDTDNGDLTTACLGDSHIVVGVQSQEAKAKGAFKITKLSEAHTPSNPDELERIHAAGGTVNHSYGDCRVGAVNVSRAIGDLEYKNTPRDEQSWSQTFASARSSFAKSTGLRSRSNSVAGNGRKEPDQDIISNEPHVDTMNLLESRRAVLVIASDGLGEEKDAQLAVTWAAREWEEGGSAEEIAQGLTKRSAYKLTGDNSTAIVVLIEA